MKKSLCLTTMTLSIRVSSLLSEDMGRPLFVQCGSKGGMMRIRPKTIIVTSQYSLDACFPEKETLAAISRRFRVHQIAPFDDTLLGPLAISPILRLPRK